MSTITFSGIDETNFKISDGDGNTTSVNIMQKPKFIPMNALDCCKDAFLATKKVDNPNLLNEINNILFGDEDWLDGWKLKLKMNFKEYMEANNYKEEEVVFERNTINVRRLNQIFFFNESGMGGARVAFGGYVEIDTGAQKTDEGPGRGDDSFRFPKEGALVFDKSFFEFFGFPNYIQSWQCETTANPDYPYNYQVITDTATFTNPQQLSVSNPAKNTLINNSIKVTNDNKNAVLFKELGDSMQTASYLAFIKIMENIDPDNRDNRDSYPINMNEYIFNYIRQKSEGNFKKLIYYLTIMLTSDNTVHYRNIKLGLPSCLTGSHEEKPYDKSTKTGRIFLPLTDPSEKLKSLLEMENTLVAKNNREIFQRLQTANLNRHLYYFKQSRGSPREKLISELLNTSAIFDFITNLTTLSQEYYDTILNDIKAIGSTIDEDTYESIRDRIIGIKDSGFKPYLCPPFVIPLPPIPNITDPSARQINRKGCIISLAVNDLSIKDGNGTDVSLNTIINDTLNNAGLNLTTFLGGGEKGSIYGGMDDDNMDDDIDDDRPYDPITTKRLVDNHNNYMNSVVDRSIVYRFSGSEKCIIYLLSRLITQRESQRDYEYYKEIFFYYTNCIYALQYYKNIPDYDFGPSDEEYAYLRLNRAILSLKDIIPDFNVDILNYYIQQGLNHLNDNGIGDNPNNNPLFLEDEIDANIDIALLVSFENIFEYISDYDDDSQKIDIAYLSGQCTNRFSSLTQHKILGQGIQSYDKCIAISEIIDMLNHKYNEPALEGQELYVFLNTLDNEHFVNPFTTLQFSREVIDEIRKQANPIRTTRESSSYGGNKKAKKTKKKRKTKKHTKKIKYRKKKSKSKTIRKTEKKRK